MEGVADAARRQGSAQKARRAGPVVPLLAATVVASGTLLLVLGSRLTFFLDDWEFLLYRPGWTAHSVLTPHGEHISIGPIVIYKLLQDTFGMDSAFPFRVVSTAVFLLSAVLLFVLLRGRIGDWLALVGASLILFLGAAWQDILWPFQIGYFGAMAAGQGALLALERRDRLGDRLACGLLTVSVLFSTLGLSFAAGAGTDIWLRRREWRRRIFIVLIPLALYGVWWIGWGHDAKTTASFHNLLTAPRYLFDSIGAGLASLLGLNTPSVRSHLPGVTFDRLLALAALLLAGWRLYRLRQVPPWLWVVAAVASAFWILAGVNTGPFRTPTESRYQYISGIFILLLATELMRGVRVGWRSLAVISVLAAAAVASNLKYLHDAYLSYKYTSDIEKADLGAIEVARARVAPSFVLDPGLADTEYVHVDAGAYLAATDRYGSPADTPAELVDAPDGPQVAADKVLAAALRLELVPGPVPAAGRVAGSSPKLIGSRSALLRRRDGCLTVRGNRAGAPKLLLRPGGVTMTSTAPQSTHLFLGRLSAGFPVELGSPSSRRAVLAIPQDRLQKPWRLLIDSSRPTTVCARSGG
jgi:hypothetical protein